MISASEIEVGSQKSLLGLPINEKATNHQSPFTQNSPFTQYYYVSLIYTIQEKYIQFVVELIA